MIVIHAADLHLGSPLRGLDRHAGLPVDRIRRAPMDAFERLADLCEGEEAALLLIAGDLFDGDAPLSVVREAVAVLRRIVAGGTQVVMLRGNHDAAQRMQRHLPRLEGLHELSTSEPDTLDLPELGVAVHGRGFDEQHLTENIVRDYPARVQGRFNVGLLHTSLEGNAAHAVYAPCSVADLTAKGYDYWALGHIHQHGIVSRDPWVVYAGSPQGRHVNERGDFGAYVLEVDGGEVTGEPRHVPLASVHWHHVEVAVDERCADAQAIVELAATELGERAASRSATDLHVARLTITGRCDAHAELVRDPDACRDQLHLAAQAVTAADVVLERVRFDVRPQLPDPAELHSRGDYVGRLAIHLDGLDLVWRDQAGDGPPIEMPDPLAVLDKRLEGLADDDTAALRGGEVVVDELELATEHLLSRLVAASTAAAEEAAR